MRRDMAHVKVIEWRNTVKLCIKLCLSWEGTAIVIGRRMGGS